MSKNLIGNAPHQVPSNADLGELAYQNSYWVRVGNITVDYHTTITGNTTILGNLILSSSTANIVLGSGANLIMSGGSIQLTTGNISTGGNINAVGNISTGGNINAVGNISSSSNISAVGNISLSGNLLLTTGNIVTSGNIVITTGNIVTNGNVNVTGTGNVRIDSVLITQGDIFCNVATQNFEGNAVTTKRYLDSQLVVFGF